MSAIGVLAQNLSSRLEKGIKCDSWGQRLEASQEYKKFISEYSEASLSMTMDEKQETAMNQIIANIRTRSNQLKDAPGVSFNNKPVDLDQIKEDYKTFTELIKNFQRTLNKRHSSVVAECGENRYGTDLAQVQNTPPSYHIQGQYIIFLMNVHVPIALEDVEAITSDFAIFFEFKHYKDKKDKVSTRCFGFVEPDELKDGISTIELYKKPVDYGRKKLYLFTEKTLYLHLRYTLERT